MLAVQATEEFRRLPVAHSRNDVVKWEKVVKAPGAKVD
jgi:hypothetical protein